MPSIARLGEAMRKSQQNVAYNDLYRVCEHYFGKPRQVLKAIDKKEAM
ncbi:hypothetical protein ACGFLT_06925 [Micromonospora chalcea]|nr:hypothetical protein [Micromonospora sp. B006]